MSTWREEMASLENADRDPIAPQYLMSVIDHAAGSDAILTCDSGTIATWAARHWTIRETASSTSRATSPPWHPDCPTRSPLSTPTPGGR